MLQGEQSAILLTFIKLPFVFKTFVLSIFEWLLKTGFTVFPYSSASRTRWNTEILHAPSSAICFPEDIVQAAWVNRVLCTFVVHVQQIRFSHDDTHINIYLVLL